jgi:hypothetical protein
MAPDCTRKWGRIIPFRRLPETTATGVPDAKESPDLMIIHRKDAKDAKKSTKIFR